MPASVSVQVYDTVEIASNATVSDSDNERMGETVLTITHGYVPGEDKLELEASVLRIAQLEDRAPGEWLA